VLAGAMLLVILSAYALRSPLAPSRPIRSLAVLPLENLSHDPEQGYFAEGMTDELITALAKIGALRVVSRTSVVHYRGTKKPLLEIARELNVDALIEGTVLRAQNRVRITAQLIRASPEEHLWAERYEGNLAEILTLQNTVAQDVARSIKIYQDQPDAAGADSACCATRGRSHRLRSLFERTLLVGSQRRTGFGEEPGLPRAGYPKRPGLRLGMGWSG
jgi:TolB-like protein